MSFSKSKVSRKDFLWKCVIEVSREKYIRCKFYNKRCMRMVNKLKHHVVGTCHGMKPCTKVSANVRLELKNFREQI